MADAKNTPTKPPETNADGVAMSGKYPANLRLRAEALSKAGAKDDPDGLVDGDAIVAAGKRVKSLEKAASDDSGSDSKSKGN